MSYPGAVPGVPGGDAFDANRSSYVPPHLRGGAPPPPPGIVGGYGAPPPQFGGYGGGRGAPYGGGGGRGFGGPPRQGGGGGRGYGGRGFGGGRGYGAGSERPDADPFAADEKLKAEADTIFGQENTGINFDAYDDIPVETSGHNIPPHIENFEDYAGELTESVMANIRRCKYSKPTPVQKHAIPIGLSGRDMMACAQTGSGKTAAFCFPIIASILKAGVPLSIRSRKACPYALVLSPTRELSSQIYDEARKFTYQTGIRPVVIYGGAAVVNQVSREGAARSGARDLRAGGAAAAPRPLRPRGPCPRRPRA
jgi:ATP-dependent RNA helicase DDX3X